MSESGHQRSAQATAQIGPAMLASLSVNSFLPEAVIISRSLARVMP
jgi:hypothetical protein